MLRCWSVIAQRATAARLNSAAERDARLRLGCLTRYCPRWDGGPRTYQLVGADNSTRSHLLERGEHRGQRLTRAPTDSSLGELMIQPDFRLAVVAAPDRSGQAHRAFRRLALLFASCFVMLVGSGVGAGSSWALQRCGTIVTGKDQLANGDAIRASGVSCSRARRLTRRFNFEPSCVHLRCTVGGFACHPTYIEPSRGELWRIRCSHGRSWFSFTGGA